MAATETKVFKKIEVIEGGGHHGGGWKVAYADFMTAMMAFFLLMWILASSDEQALKGIAQYFTDATLPGGSGVLDGATIGPPGTLSASNGAIVARGSEVGEIDDPTPATWEIRDVTPSVTDDGAAATNVSGDREAPGDGASTDSEAAQNIDGQQHSAAGQADFQSEEAKNLHAADEARFEALQEEILQAIQENPNLDNLEQSVIFEETPEGLHIQIIDQEGQPMFSSGRAEMLGATEELITNLGKSLAEIPNKVVISGHTDAVPFAANANYDNWDLSADRANATSRVFANNGVSADRIVRVSGLADTQLLVPEDPTAPSNRRISIMVQYKTPEMEKPVAEAEQTAAPIEEEAANQSAPETQETTAPAPAVVTEEEASAVPTANEEVFDNLRNALR